MKLNPCRAHPLVRSLALAAALVVSGCPVSILHGQTAAPEAPKVDDATLQVTLFAQEPLVQQPIGMTFTKDGKLLVIQSNTHFPPKGFTGPKVDRILWLQDADGDGKAEKSEVFF
ncbi:MAG: hypothetical protein ACAH88_07175, partial [Roseimicrobium sp.]